MMIVEDLNSKIDGVNSVIEDYHTKIKLHQNRVDYLEQMKSEIESDAALDTRKD